MSTFFGCSRLPYLLGFRKPRLDDYGDPEQRCSQAHFQTQRSGPPGDIATNRRSGGAQDRGIRDRPLDDR